MITAGIDCGSKNTKTIVLEDLNIIGKGKVLTGFDLEKAIKESLEAACKAANLSEKDIKKFGGTGGGRDAVKGAVPINDIKTMARAAYLFFPDGRTVVDVGAEEARAVKVDEKGNPVDFVINEKCAAGAGAFIEAMSLALETPIEQMGPLALTSNRKIPMNAQCAIFAESEVVGMIHAQIPKNDISKAIHDAIASRIVSMIRRIGINEEIVIMGGMANNPGFIKAIMTQLNVRKIWIPDDPEYGSAVGAAIAAGE